MFIDLLVNARFNLGGVFSDGLPNLVGYIQVLKDIVKEFDVKVYNRLEVVGLGSFCFAYQWVITLFTYSMPLESVTEVWTLFIDQGWSIMFKAFLVLILDVSVKLETSDFAQCFQLLRDAPANIR